MADAVNRRLLRADFFRCIEPRWTFPQLVTRDRTRERMADVRLVETSILSRAEVARRDGVDPQLMREELVTEETPPGSGGLPTPTNDAGAAFQGR